MVMAVAVVPVAEAVVASVVVASKEKSPEPETSLGPSLLAVVTVVAPKLKGLTAAVAAVVVAVAMVAEAPKEKAGGGGPTAAVESGVAA